MARIDLEGFDELNDLLQKMTLTEEDEKAAIRAALKPLKEEVQKNTPVRSGSGGGKLKANIRTRIGREDGQFVGKVTLGEHYGRFQEYGTSTQSKNKGFFARSIRVGKKAAMKVLKAEILSRLK